MPLVLQQVISFEFFRLVIFSVYILVLHSDEWKGTMQYFTRFSLLCLWILIGFYWSGLQVCRLCIEPLRTLGESKQSPPSTNQNRYRKLRINVRNLAFFPTQANFYFFCRFKVRIVEIVLVGRGEYQQAYGDFI